MDLQEFASAPPTRFGRYEVVRRLGRGGMGEVFEARHVDLGTRVAIKSMRPPHGDDAGAVRRVLREGRAAGAIRHPHVVAVLDVGTEQGTPYLVMELLEGEDLARRLYRAAPLTVEETADLILPLVSGVTAAHHAGIVHRDLKPSNVFLARRGDAVEPVLVDFGISKHIHPTADPSTWSSGLAGTPQYMAPEQLRGTIDVTGQTDQYGLGLLLYECVTGGTPFYGEDYYELMLAIMTAKVVAPSELNPVVPSVFDDLVLRALARDPKDRFATTAALGASLLPFASREGERKWQREFSLAKDVGGSVAGFAVNVRAEERPRDPRAAHSPLWAFAASLPMVVLSGAIWAERAPPPATGGASCFAAAPTPMAAGAPTPMVAGAPTPMAAGAPTPMAAAAPTPMATGAPDPVAGEAPREASAPAGDAPAVSQAPAKAPAVRPAVRAVAVPKASARPAGGPPAASPPSLRVERGTRDIPIVE